MYNTDGYYDGWNAFFSKNVYTVNLGDSRAYRFRAGQLTQISKDHVSSQSMPADRLVLICAAYTQGAEIPGLQDPKPVTMVSESVPESGPEPAFMPVIDSTSDTDTMPILVPTIDPAQNNSNSIVEPMSKEEKQWRSI